jgi:predicted RNA methylase
MRTIGLKRDTTDKFYTNINVAQECIDRLLLQVSQDDVFLEPAAGNGSFCCLLWDRGIECIALDIDPQYSNIQQGDFLKYEIETDRRPIHAIGNPPFGRQSCVAIQFIRRACLFCDTVALHHASNFN